MVSRTLTKLALGGGAVTLVMAMVSPTARRMFPAYVMFRQVGTQQPLLLYHSGVQVVTIRGRSGVEVGNDPLAILYSGLRPAGEVDAERLKTATYVEVAEFFGPAYTTDADGRPIGDKKFESANHFSRIYVGRGDQRPIWENPVVAPGGANSRYYEISDVGQQVLTKLGMQLREAAASKGN